MRVGRSNVSNPRVTYLLKLTKPSKKHEKFGESKLDHPTHGVLGEISEIGFRSKYDFTKISLQHFAWTIFT